MEKLPDYLDRMIGDMYVKVERGRGRISQSPLHTAVVEYIEDESTGRPHPIEDSADHYLLRHFDMARRMMANWPLPTGLKFRGAVIRYKNAFLDPLDFEYGDTAAGEIPWRTMHKE